MSVYLDHNATTPIDNEVLDAMMPFLHDYYGNPASVHSYGRKTRVALDQAREQVASLVKAHPGQVIFTSGGTESNNLAIKGITPSKKLNAIAISEIEHTSIIAPAQAMQKRGWELDLIKADSGGRVLPAALADVIRDETCLVSVMMANNETGVLQDVAAISDMARAHGIIVHTDAVQAAGKIAIDFESTGAHMMSLSAHKLYGPKGVGALIVDKSLELEPLIHGIGHEMGMRGGTENVAGIVGFGKAAELAMNNLEKRTSCLLELRRYLENGLHGMAGVTIVAGQSARLSNTICMLAQGIEGETLLMNLDRAGIAVSSGSACASGSTNPSHVLLAMGIDRDLARCAIRISLGKDNTHTDIDIFLNALGREVAKLQMPELSAWAS
ncbi:MAG TPA: cysteine desulfurase family protein [Gammaproteobacteria bacterium]